MRRWTTWSALALAVFVMAGAATAQRAKEPIPVGIIGDLSGPTSGLAEMAYSSRDYFNYINEKKGGILGHEVDVLLVDGAEVIPVEVSNYKRIMTRHKPAFVFIWSTGGAKALRDPVNKVDRIPSIAESISEELVDPKGLPFSFVIGPTYEDQFRLGLESFKKQGGKRVAVARCNLDWCVSPTDRVIKEGTPGKLGLELVETVTWPARPTDLTSEALRLKQANPDFIWLQDTVEGTVPFLRDIVKAGIPPSKVLGVHWTRHPAIESQVGKGADGFQTLDVFPDVDTLVRGGHPVGKEIEEYQAAHKGRRGQLRTWYYVRGWVKGKLVAEAIERALKKTGGAAPKDLAAFRKAVRDEFEGIANYDAGAALPPINYRDHKGFVGARLVTVKDGLFQYTSDWIQVTTK
jgi:ABC-type branched-subunit amino acid transport system substrate-binding protein